MINEAIAAGEQALDSLYAAKQKLDSAKGWSWVDLFGGGFITDMIKHGKIEDASRCMEDAKCNLRIFQQELSDAQISVDLDMEVGEFLAFADFFFDGLIADYLVQSMIEDARRQVADAIGQVSDILEKLTANTVC
mgnify:FL=1